MLSQEHCAETNNPKMPDMTKMFFVSNRMPVPKQLWMQRCSADQDDRERDTTRQKTTTKERCWCTEVNVYVVYIPSTGETENTYTQRPHARKTHTTHRPNTQSKHTDSHKPRPRPQNSFLLLCCFFLFVVPHFDFFNRNQFPLEKKN